MGEIADHYIDKMLGFASKYNEIAGARGRKYSKIPPKRMTWVTGDGRVLWIDEMESGHILNCLHLIESKHGHMGPLTLNQAPTYKCMVDILIGRGVLTGRYYQLTIPDRLRIRMEG